jgi:predicted transcriptional regulator YdeE
MKLQKTETVAEIDAVYLIGLALKYQTENANGRSAADCGKLWQEFLNGNYADRVPAKLSEDILAVYHDYVGDHTQPYSYFIGCKAKPGTAVPAGFDSFLIPEGTYQKFTVKGEIPGSVGGAWQEIWKSAIPRAYRPDFEVYDERSKDGENAVVDIFISVKS